MRVSLHAVWVLKIKSYWKHFIILKCICFGDSNRKARAACSQMGLLLDFLVPGLTDDGEDTPVA